MPIARHALPLAAAALTLYGCAADRQAPLRTPANLLCPSGKPDGTPLAPGASTFPVDRLVGLDLSAATKVARRAGCVVRVGIVDGELKAGTADYSPERINVEVRDGEVVAVLGVD